MFKCWRRWENKKGDVWGRFFLLLCSLTSLPFQMRANSRGSLKEKDWRILSIIFRGCFIIQLNKCMHSFPKRKWDLQCISNDREEEGIQDRIGYVISVLMGTRSTSCSGESNLLDWCTEGFRMRYVLHPGRKKNSAATQHLKWARGHVSSLDPKIWLNPYISYK